MPRRPQGPPRLQHGIPLTPPRPSTPPPAAYTPPAGFPADPQEMLAYLRVGQFTDEQVRYLRSIALTQYVTAINTARAMPGMEATVALGDQIIAAWLARLAELGPPPPATNPFNP